MVTLALVLAGCAAKPTLEEARYLPRFGKPQSAATRPTTVPAYAYSARVASETGWDFLRRGRLDDAMDDFNAAWSIDPAAPEPLWGMAVVQTERAEKLGPDRGGLADLDDACGLFDDARHQAPPDPRLTIDAARAHAERGRFRQTLKRSGADDDFVQASRLLDEAAAGPSAPFYEARALLERDRGDYSAAVADDARAATQPATRPGPPPSTMPVPVVAPAPPKAARSKSAPATRPHATTHAASRPTTRPTSRPHATSRPRATSEPVSRPDRVD